MKNKSESIMPCRISSCVPGYLLPLKDRVPESTLHYVSAAHGGWGIVRVAALVPESHLFFVCPSACGRHNSLGGAQNGIKDRISYLFIDEADIVGGCFEEMICEGVGTLLETLIKKPKVIFIYTSCLDDLLGTDHELILGRLSKEHPEVRFRHCRMNPISLDSPLPPGITTASEMFSLLEERHADRPFVNIIGSNISLPRDSDLRQLLKSAGYELSCIADCRTFEDFQAMADARLNIVSSPIALNAAIEMEKRLGIPYISAFVCYDPDEIDLFYKKLSERLGTDLARGSDKYRRRSLREIERTREHLRGCPVAVDYQAVLRPYSLALMLFKNGFNIQLIASDTVPAAELKSYEKLLWLFPDINTADPLSHKAVKFPLHGNHLLCIGFDCGYMTGSDKVVNLMEDEGMYGFDGIIRLMKMIRDAFDSSADVGEMITEAALII